MKSKRGAEITRTVPLLASCVATGEGIHHHVEGVGFIFDGEVEAKKIVDPMMLRDRGEALIK
jgi:hypothetical protein